MLSTMFRRVIAALRRCRASTRARVTTLAALLLFVPALPLPAQQVGQVADLFTGAGTEQSSFTRGDNGVLGGLTYFALEDREHGRELWVTDGTAANTHLFADICPGQCSSNPTDFSTAGVLLFAADDGRHGSEPWRLVNGASAPTMIEDINPGARSSSPSGWKLQKAMAGTSGSFRVYFSATDRDHGRELWRVSLSGSTATLEADIEPGSGSSSPEMIGAVDGGQKLLVVASTGANGREPHLLSYATLSSPPSVSLLVDSSASASGGVREAAALGGKVWFAVFDSTQPSNQQASVWSSDGTLANTTKLLVLRSASALVPNASLSRMFFIAATPAAGRELYASDGSVAGTGMVKDINPGAADAFSGNPLVTRGGVVLFLANDGTHGTELWSSNGSAAGTTLVKELEGGSGGVGGEIVGAADGSLAYITHFGQLWRSDGSAAGTTAVSFDSGGSIIGLTATSGTGVLFGSNLAGFEPWFSDGTASGTVPLGNFNDGVGDANPKAFAPIGERMSFVARDDSTVAAMHATTGSGASTWFGQALTPLGYLGARLLFGGATNPDTLQLSDGTAGGTTSLPSVELSSSNGYGPPFRCSVALNGSIWFIAADPSSNDDEVYRSDGSAGGAIQVTNLSATGGLVSDCDDDDANMVGVNGQVLFVGDLDDSGTGTGVELVRSNGIDPAQLVFDINPGPSASFPQFLTALGNKAVFVARTATADYEPWVTDGTAQGTRLLKDIAPGATPSDPEALVVAGNQVFFTADNATSGRELWVTDGTPAGTRMVVDLYPGVGSAFRQSARRPLAVQGRRVYFHAIVPTDDCALFVSDGTAAGTHCAVDPLQGLSVSGTDEVLALPSGVVAFTAWRASDGDEVRALRDGTLLSLPGGNIRAGAGSSQPQNLTATPRGMVYFSADDGNSGREVWRLDLTDFIFADGLE